MAFFKLRNRGAQGNEARNAGVPTAPAESVEAMRRRARHRLLGAAVLVLLGVIGFPLLFDTQPRPVAVDIPIEIPDRNKVKPLAVPNVPVPVVQAPAVSPPVAVPVAPSVIAAAPSSTGMITERADGTEIVPGRPVQVVPPSRTASPPETRPESKPELRTDVRPRGDPKPEPKSKPEPKPEPDPKPDVRPAVRPVARSEDGARAKALLEGKPADATDARPAAVAGDQPGRFAVQVGAFADVAKAREARQKLESAGLKTYTTVTRTADGERTRVRAGPFTNRAEADKAAGKIKGLALSAAVLPL